MKRPNHYIWLTIIWFFTAVIDTAVCIVNFVDGDLAIGTMLAFIAVGFAFVAGLLFEKAAQIAEMNRQAKWLHDFAKDLAEMGKELEKARQAEIDGDPFAEFINEKNVPFPEAERKEK